MVHVKGLVIANLPESGRRSVLFDIAGNFTIRSERKADLCLFIAFYSMVLDTENKIIPRPGSQHTIRNSGTGTSHPHSKLFISRNTERHSPGLFRFG